ncbi:hypothetical protein MiSe_55110 [Microseira wollei NIES-4236]|uniref:Uncharacterized protein n=1 Tax=Microseira wollei NIES-4236 TaxID=2530354 RepID=A0AAV3XFR1_9CYAN|nr:hypothetical protein MiSe_55110 [Microseira wollei NIES-4236]
MADLGRLPRAQQRRETYKRGYDRAYEQYRRQIYEQYSRRLPPNLRQQIPTRQPEAIPVPTRLPRRTSDPRLARRPQSNSPVSQSQQQRTRPQDLPGFKEPFAEPELRSPLNLQPPPVKPKPPRPLLRQALDKSRQIHDKLERFKRGLNDLACPGLNETSDFFPTKLSGLLKNFGGSGGWLEIFYNQRENIKRLHRPILNLT